MRDVATAAGAIDGSTEGSLMSAGAAPRMASMRAAVIDVGSNTVRLLVAAPSRRGLNTILSERTHLGLGADIERDGLLSERKILEAAELVGRYAALARSCGARGLEVLVTAPGRQGRNAGFLHRLLGEASAAPVRQLSAEEEGRLAYAGAVAACRSKPQSVAVCDVGGGSTQLMVGPPSEPAWLRSLDLGSLRLTERFLRAATPEPGELSAATRAVREAFQGVVAPVPRLGLATGGTARALRKIVGRRLGEQELLAALRLLGAEPAAVVADSYGIPPERARTLAAGAIILLEARRRLGVPLEVARGGVREGAALALLAQLAAEAA
jgi:exopolyphosphatase/guanosine-5'-triphosphate,3'-diphosphate pyrophosphatase